MDIKNINIDDLRIDINGETKEITYELLQEINDFNSEIVDVYATDCEGTVQKWVFKSIPKRYVVVLADDSVISDTDTKEITYELLNEYHDSIDPDNAFNF